jgi:type II secretory pathway predicted ATPase ExeA
MLSNLETDSEKLFQIILVGQPELKDKINSPRLKQLKQRIAVRFHISALQKDEVEKYIYHRLTVAGSAGDIRFTDDAMDFIFKFTGGIPRTINMLCDKSLLAAYVLSTREIALSIVEKSAKELEGIVL